MNTMNVLLSTQEDAVKFVSTVSKYPFDVDLGEDAYRTSGRTFPGITVLYGLKMQIEKRLRKGKKIPSAAVFLFSRETGRADMPFEIHPKNSKISGSWQQLFSCSLQISQNILQ